MAKSTTAPAAAPTPAFEIESGIPLPKKRGGGGGGKRGPRGSKYPFEALEVSQSFHVPAEDETKAATLAKTMSSIVTNFQARYAHNKLDASGNPILVKRNTRNGEAMYPDKEYERKFSVRVVGNDDPKGPGARIFRVA